MYIIVCVCLYVNYRTRIKHPYTLKHNSAKTEKTERSGGQEVNAEDAAREAEQRSRQRARPMPQ